MKKLKSFLVFGVLLLAVGEARANITSTLTPPAGVNGNVQFNKRGNFGADPTFTYSTTTKNLSVSTITLGGCINFPNGTVLCSSPTAGGGSGTPGGSNTQVQFNDGGFFNGTSSFTFNKTTDVLNLIGKTTLFSDASTTGNFNLALYNTGNGGFSTNGGGIGLYLRNGAGSDVNTSKIWDVGNQFSAGSESGWVFFSVKSNGAFPVQPILALRGSSFGDLIQVNAPIAGKLGGGISIGDNSDPITLTFVGGSSSGAISWDSTSSKFTINKFLNFSSHTVHNLQSEERFADADSSNYVGFKSPAVVSSNKIWTLPSADGSADQALSTNGSGTFSFQSYVLNSSSGNFVQNRNTLQLGSTFFTQSGHVQGTLFASIIMSTNNDTVEFPGGIHIPDSESISGGGGLLSGNWAISSTDDFLYINGNSNNSSGNGMRIALSGGLPISPGTTTGYVQIGPGTSSPPITFDNQSNLWVKNLLLVSSNTQLLDGLVVTSTSDGRGISFTANTPTAGSNQSGGSITLTAGGIDTINETAAGTITLTAGQGDDTQSGGAITLNAGNAINGGGNINLNTGSAGTNGDVVIQRGNIVMGSGGTKTTLTQSGVAAIRTITLPAATASLATLGLSETFSGLKTFTGGLTVQTANMTITDVNVALNTTTGTKFGTATNQKLSFYNSTPITQPSAITDLGVVLSNLGLRAAGTAFPLTTSGNLSLTGASIAINPVTNYNNTTTVSQGMPSLVAQVNLTAQSSTITATTLYAVPNTGAATDMYRISWVATITSTASTSCVLGGTNGFQIQYTDGDDSVVKTSSGPVINSTNNETSTTISGVLNAQCKKQTNLQYLFGYTSVGAQAMQYALHIRVEPL